MSQKPKNKIPKPISKASKIIAHWKEFYGDQESYHLLRGVAELDDNLDSLAKHIGRVLTEDEQNDVLDIVDDFMPKDEDGNFRGPLISFEKAWEVCELRNQVKKLTKNK